ncbi:substrate-binding domain-containing protein [Paenibacillus sp. DXFW5]|uniref:Substrate-binding domain-containing protein n=1 Tax=Paenibacillus rhizolycopersici TaxID=2780073 RepID=A0ABS2H668_9BACL|nr:substrate-binding domain-containing protein [Paenibacillus rhizolycopersici]MBM6995310.1 substrate-binding domain-containing protein [Paenibacillus rhizolycopersici]
MAGPERVVHFFRSEDRYCLARKSSPNSLRRTAAYRDFLADKHQAHRPDYAFYDCALLEDGEWIMERIRRMEDPPTALLVTSDQVAAGILAYCTERGFRGPDELALVGFDNQSIAKMQNLTSFEIPPPDLEVPLISSNVRRYRPHGSRFIPSKGSDGCSRKSSSVGSRGSWRRTHRP